jgi:acyl-CoA thioesterase-1
LGYKASRRSHLDGQGGTVKGRGETVRLGAVALFLATMLGLAAAGAAEALWLPPGGFSTNNPDLAVAIGDSITLGVVGGPDCPNPDCVADRPYPAGLQALLRARDPGFGVANAGRGGETTQGGLDRLPGVLAAFRPGFLLIMEGTNDATFRVDPAIIVSNLRAMVQLAKANGTIPLLGSIVPNFRDVPETQGIVATVNAMLPGVAAMEDVLFVDTFTPLNNGGLYGADRLHPNQAGYDVLAAAWVPAVTAAVDATRLLRTYLAVDAPLPGSTVLEPFAAGGWALDPRATSGTGVDGVHAYAFPLAGGPPVFLGVAGYGAARPDVGALFGAQFTNSGWSVGVLGLAPGPYQLVFYAHSTVTGGFSVVRTVVVNVESRALMAIDTPANGTRLSQPFLLGGWAIDLDAPTGTGVDAVHVWAFPLTGGAAVFVGVAAYGGARPDLGAIFGSRFTDSGYALLVSGLAPGAYQLVAYAHSSASGTFNDLRSVLVTIDPSALTFVDTPGPGATVAQPFLVAGWAVDLQAVSGTGVDAVHVYAFPDAGGPPIFLGVAAYGGSRPDVGSLLGARFTDSGYGLLALGLMPGRYQLAVYAHSTVAGSFDGRALAIDVQ